MGDDLSFFQLTERYPDEASAVAYFEGKRWPRGVTCVGCGSTNVYNCQARRRLPLYKCRDCDRQFTVTSGTVMNKTHLPLRAWLFAFHMMGGSKKGISTRQIARHLGITIKSAWHLSHRIRATMKENSQFFAGGIVESDETYIGGRRRGRGRGYRGNKIPVQVIVERKRRTPTSSGSSYQPRKECTTECPGRAQTMVLGPSAEKVDGRSVGANLRKHTDPETTHLMTDESPIYDKVGKSFRKHDSVNHKKGEYARTDKTTGVLVSTNAAEGLIGNLKRQITGTHHSVSKKHLPRYLEEYDHKYNNRHKTDTEITEDAISRFAETKPVTLYKSESGQGESLIDTKQGEAREHKTLRGQHMKRWPRVGGRMPRSPEEER
jgi:transposase-like protein